MTDTAFSIHTMNAKELELAINWAKREGWNPGRCDATLFYQADPGGFFAGKINGQTIAVGSAVAYDETFAFCGLYIVAPEYRWQRIWLGANRTSLSLLWWPQRWY